jgi:hypothetical protein
VSATTWQSALIGARFRIFQKLLQRYGSSLMQGCPQTHFHGFQIYSSVVLTLGKDSAQPAADVPRDLLMDRNNRFFSCTLQPPGPSSTGRSLQIFSLSATSSSLNF